MSTVENLRAARLIVDHACDVVGLPVPRVISVSGFDTDRSPAIDLMAASLSDLTDWALWMEAQVESENCGEHVHHRVQGEVLEQRIGVFYVEKVQNLEAAS